MTEEQRARNLQAFAARLAADLDPLVDVLLADGVPAAAVRGDVEWTSDVVTADLQHRCNQADGGRQPVVHQRGHETYAQQVIAGLQQQGWSPEKIQQVLQWSIGYLRAGGHQTGSSAA